MNKSQNENPRHRPGVQNKLRRRRGIYTPVSLFKLAMAGISRSFELWHKALKATYTLRLGRSSQ